LFLVEVDRPDRAEVEDLPERLLLIADQERKRGARPGRDDFPADRLVDGEETGIEVLEA
jgi:hypothetical protein